MVKRLLIGAMVLIAPAIQPMDAPGYDYSSLPLDLKREIVHHIVSSHDFVRLKHFAKLNSQNNTLVREYLARYADEIIHRSFASSDGKNGITFLYGLTRFDKQMAEKIREYISQNELKFLINGSACLPETAVILRRYTIAKIMLENPTITIDCLDRIKLDDIAKAAGFYFDQNPNIPEMIDFLDAYLSKKASFNKKLIPETEANELRMLALHPRPLPLIRLVLTHKKEYINYIFDDPGFIDREKQTILDTAIALENAYGIEPELYTDYKQKLIELLRSYGAQRYQELQNEAE